jgi:hypothetical protein
VDITSQKELPERRRKAPFLLKKELRLSWFDLAIQKCLLKKISRDVEKTLGRGIRATQQKTNFQPDTGLVRRGNMNVEEVLKLLEKHEEECNRRYAKIDSQLDKLDVRLWGIVALIIASALAERFF